MEVTKIVINGIEISTLDKPIGLEAIKLSLDRDFQYSCIDTKIEAELKFYCASGKTELDAEYESKGVTLVSICSKGTKKLKACQEAIPTKNMEKFLNTFDEYQRYRQKIHIRSTPKIFILDKDKKILIKDIPASELKNIMPEIIKIESKS